MRADAKGLVVEWVAEPFASKPVEGLVVAGCLEGEANPPGWLEDAVAGYLAGRLDPARLPPERAAAVYASVYGGLILVKLVDGESLPLARALTDEGFDFNTSGEGAWARGGWTLVDAMALLAAGRPRGASLLEGLPLALPGGTLVQGTRRPAPACVRAFIE